VSEQAAKKIIDRVFMQQCNGEPAADACECCHAEPMVGVASIPGIPMSIAWGLRCLEAQVVPMWAAFAQADMGWEPGHTVGREMFAEWWLETHDATLKYFKVTEEEFWEAVNAPRSECGPTDDDMYCACGCGGDDTRCELYLYTYAASPDQVPPSHVCCKIPGRD
jgi:hypothetical protein